MALCLAGSPVYEGEAIPMEILTDWTDASRVLDWTVQSNAIDQAPGIRHQGEASVGASGEASVRGATGASGEAPAEMPAVRVEALTKLYPSGTLAVDGLDLSIGRGEILGMLGPNGAGKTTT